MVRGPPISKRTTTPFPYTARCRLWPYAEPAETSAAIVDAAAESGIALTLLPVLYAHAGFGAQPPTPAQARFVHDLDGYARLLAGADAAAAHLPDIGSAS